MCINEISLSATNPITTGRKCPSAILSSTFLLYFIESKQVIERERVRAKNNVIFLRESTFDYESNWLWNNWNEYIRTRRGILECLLSTTIMRKSGFLEGETCTLIKDYSSLARLYVLSLSRVKYYCILVYLQSKLKKECEANRLALQDYCVIYL